MARARNIKPAIMDNEQLAELPALTRLLFVYLWMLADREGRLEDRPKRIGAQALPYDRDADVNEMLAELCADGFIHRFEVAGKKVIQIASFHKHQTPHGTEKDSELPDADGLFCIHSRGNNGYANGSITFKNSDGTVAKQASNKNLTVKEHPDSLIPDSLIPELKDPNGSRRQADPQLPNCPHDQIVGLYHEALPELPAVKVMSESRQKAMRGFWRWVLTSKKSDGSPRAQTVDQALTWIGNYFDRAKSNDFLMGRRSAGQGHDNWRCDFDFLLTEKGKRHVIEKTADTA